ncbi:MAG: ribonuclease HI [Flavobacteriaceae bacterium]|nr:ribonuclease HI [Flavobacteriaceae bacterium]|tara:strand:+ start:678 stop:1166 length:489 start_codon:yes stop_codon:yes gene_type:complete
MSKADKEILLYTDGSSIGNPGPGGYGIIMELKGTTYKKEFSKGFRHTTNNRMELMAIIVGLESIKKEFSKVTVYSDSKYVVDSINKKWVFEWQKKGFKGKKNPDLWERFIRVYKRYHLDFIWIKGHNSHPQNERCDFLANTAAKKDDLINDEYYENISKYND